jgi:hypothetical protein
MISYGYITGVFAPCSDDITWTGNRYEKNGSESLYIFIKSCHVLDNDNVTLIGSNKQFIKWRDKYKPKENEEIKNAKYNY